MGGRTCARRMSPGRGGGLNSRDRGEGAQFLVRMSSPDQRDGCTHIDDEDQSYIGGLPLA